MRDDVAERDDLAPSRNFLRKRQIRFRQLTERLTDDFIFRSTAERSRSFLANCSNPTPSRKDSMASAAVKMS